MNFNFITAAETWHYFDVKTFEGVVLVTTLVFLGVLLLAGLGFWFFQRKNFKKFGLGAFIASIVYSLVVGIVCFVNEVKGNADYNQNYQLLIAIFLIVAVILCGALMFFLNRIKRHAAEKEDEKTVKIINISMLATGIAASIATVIVFVFAIIKNNSQIDALTKQSQTLLGACVFLILMTAFIFFIVSGKKKGDDTIAAVYAAITIALSFALSYVRLFKMPYGGTITLASVAPIAVYSYMFGVRRGLLCCLIYGMLQAIQDPWIVHPVQFVLDYPIAFTMFGLAGIFKGKFKRPALSIALGIALCAVLRFCCHLISGAVYFGSAGIEYGLSPWVYSLAYNSLYIVPDAAIAIVAAAFLLGSRQVLAQMNSVEARFMRNERKKSTTLSQPVSADVENGKNETTLPDAKTEPISGETNDSLIEK